MTVNPDQTPSGDGHYPRLSRALLPDLGDEHPRSMDQARAFAAIAASRSDPWHFDPPVVEFALVICAPELHGGRSSVVGAVWRVGDRFVYAASVPDAHLTIPTIEDRRYDFAAVGHEQWVWPLDAPEAEALRAYCPRHHKRPLWIDRANLLLEIEDIQPRHAQRSYVQLSRVARIVT